jgi:hypothetical protein
MNLTEKLKPYTAVPLIKKIGKHWQINPLLAADEPDRQRDVHFETDDDEPEENMDGLQVRQGR